MDESYRRSDPSALGAAIDLPADHARVLHRGARKGLVAVATRPGWHEEAVALADLEGYVSRVALDRDVYLSQGRFRMRRRVANLISLNNAWVDLDCYRAALPLSPAEALDAALMRCHGTRRGHRKVCSYDYAKEAPSRGSTL